MGYTRQKPWYMMLIILTLVLLIVTLFFAAFQNVFAQDDMGQSIGLFRNNISYISDKYILNITPADWTFSIWIFIYVFQIAWVFYAQTLLCRQNKSRTGMLYCDPPFLAQQFYVVYCMNLILNVVWQFAFDSEYIVASWVALLGAWLCLQVCLFFSFKDLWYYENQLSKADMWLNIILVQNGLGLYSTWLAIATQLNFGFVLHYFFDVSMEITCYVVLGILLVLWLVWVVTDIFVTSACHTRYHFAPYAVVIVAFAGILEANWDPESNIQLFTISILGFGILSLIFKIISVIYFRIRCPLAIEGGHSW